MTWWSVRVLKPVVAIGVVRPMKAPTPAITLEDVTTTVAADLSTDLTPQERQAGERLLKRRPQLNFDEMGIAHGSELVYVKDDSLRAVVVEAKKVSFEGEIVPLSVATKRRR